MKKHALLSIAMTLILFSSATTAYASATGTIVFNHKYAWSNFGGWVNFDANASNVHITDTAITGHAWSAHEGWINLAPTNGGVTNDAEGNLGGSAWNAHIGWIDFSGVSIDASGIFRGLATGPDINGTTYAINFDCSTCLVETDWRPASVRTSTPPSPNGNGGGGPSGGGGGGAGSPASTASPPASEAPPPAFCGYENTDPRADINGDGTVGIIDFNRLMIGWGAVGMHEADINRDCVVGLLDFNQLMVAWT